MPGFARKLTGRYLRGTFFRFFDAAGKPTKALLMRSCMDRLYFLNNDMTIIGMFGVYDIHTTPSPS